MAKLNRYSCDFPARLRRSYIQYLKICVTIFRVLNTPITHLQRFLMELGSGFAFVARQKQIRIEEQERYIDLVFYHCRLKFYLLVDLKVGELTHANVGQMDGYVRMFDGLVVALDDNPTIGLILCTEKNETVARYSVLNDRKQIFASRYMLFLPTEEQLSMEIEKERRLIESNLKDQVDA